MKAALLLVLVAACTDATSGDLLSDSRVRIEELSPPILVDIDAPPGTIHVDAPLMIDGTPGPEPFATLLDNPTGPQLQLMATCNTAHGTDTTALVPVRADDGRSQTLVVDIANNGSNACLAQIQVWKDCEGAGCDAVPCSSMIPPDATTFSVSRQMDARICARVTAVDAAQIDVANDVHVDYLLGAPGTVHPPTELETDQQRNAFQDTPTPDGTTRIIAVHGAEWLVGPYTFTVTTTVEHLEIRRTFGLEIGGDSDVGFELVAPTIATEFRRSAWDIRLHHFPPATCALSVSPDPAHYASLLKDASDADGASLMYDCTPAHSHYTLGLVPGISAGQTVAAPLLIDGATALSLGVKTRSVAEDLAVCTGWAGRLTSADGACADIDSDGTLEVVRASVESMNACMTEVSVAPLGGDDDWRTASPTMLATPGTIEDVFTLATTPPQIWAVDDAGQLFKLVKTGTTTQWAAQFPGVKMGTKIVPYHDGSPNGPPNALASLLPDGRIQLLSLANGNAKRGLVTGTPRAIGAIRIGTGGASPGLVVVSNGSSTANYVVDVYPSPPLGASPIGSQDMMLQSPIRGTVGNMPAATAIDIAGRGTGQQDLVVVFYETEFASAVSELQINSASTSLTLLDQYPGANGIAPTPEGDVLLGLIAGTKLSSFASPATKTVLWDPLPPSDPSAAYGRAVVACLDSHGATIGFAETTANGARVAKRDIVPQTP